MEAFFNFVLQSLKGNEPEHFLFWGFISGFVGYAYYLFASRNDPKNHLNWLVGLYGTFLTGCAGALFALIIDQKIAYSILVGMFTNLIYMAMIRAAKSNEFLKAVKEVFIRYLTGGTKP